MDNLQNNNPKKLDEETIKELTNAIQQIQKNLMKISNILCKDVKNLYKNLNKIMEVYKNESND
jgi:hypothetical protein